MTLLGDGCLGSRNDAAHAVAFRSLDRPSLDVVRPWPSRPTACSTRAARRALLRRREGRTVRDGQQPGGHDGIPALRPSRSRPGDQGSSRGPPLHEGERAGLARTGGAFDGWRSPHGWGFNSHPDLRRPRLRRALPAPSPLDGRAVAAAVKWMSANHHKCRVKVRVVCSTGGDPGARAIG